MQKSGWKKRGLQPYYLFVRNKKLLLNDNNKIIINIIESASISGAGYAEENTQIIISGEPILLAVLAIFKIRLNGQNRKSIVCEFSYYFH